MADFMAPDGFAPPPPRPVATNGGDVPPNAQHLGGNISSSIITPPSLYGSESRALNAPATGATAPPALFGSLQSVSVAASDHQWNPQKQQQGDFDMKHMRPAGSWPMHSDGPTPAPHVTFDLSIAAGTEPTRNGALPDPDWDLSCVVLATADLAPAAATPTPNSGGFSVVDRIFWGKLRSEAVVTGGAVTHSGDADVGSGNMLSMTQPPHERLTVDLARWSAMARQQLSSKNRFRSAPGHPSALVAVVLAHPHEMPPWHAGRSTSTAPRDDDDDHASDDSDTELQDELVALSSSEVTWNVAVGVAATAGGISRLAPLANVTRPAPLPMPMSAATAGGGSVPAHLQGPARCAWRVYQDPAAWVVGIIVGAADVSRPGASSSPSSSSLFWTLLVPNSDAGLRVASFHPVALLTPSDSAETSGNARSALVTSGMAPTLHPSLPAHLAAVLDATGALGRAAGAAAQQEQDQSVLHTDRARSAHLEASFGLVNGWLGRRLARLERFAAPRQSKDRDEMASTSATVNAHASSDDAKKRQKAEPPVPAPPPRPASLAPQHPPAAAAALVQQQQQQAASASPVRAMAVALLALVIAFIMVVD